MEKAFKPSIKTESGGERRRWMELLCDISNLDVETGAEVYLTTKALTHLESAKKIKLVRMIVKNM